MEIKTHKFIINKAIEKLDINLFEKYRKYILKGARKADYSFSHLFIGSFNHYYNPIKEKGYLFFSNAKIKGKKFFENSIKNYKKGKTKKSMIQLGIALHLMADTAVPAHSRPKIHLPPILLLLSDNLENFINKNLLLAEIYLDNIKMTIKNSIDSYYEDLAKTSRNFKQGKTGLFALLLRLFGVKKIPKRDLIIQTKEIIPASVSYTMGMLHLFNNKIKK